MPETASPPATRTKTTYVILREKPVTGQDVALVYEPVASGIEANSAAAAIRSYIGSKDGLSLGSGIFVAISAKSFKPTKVRIETKS